MGQMVMNFNKTTIQIKQSIYEEILNNNDFDEIILDCFDYLNRMPKEEYYLFLNYIYSKFNYKVFNTIMVGILKLFNTLANYTLSDLDQNYTLAEKKCILNAYKVIKEKDGIINGFYVSKLRNDNSNYKVKRFNNRR